ncbi:MAG: TIGR02391 family protein [Chloroflexi bacterium]|nr:TIGR02391 family protein [Chloroflexota bacterium]MBU1748964.1 TIGR02391 family protein [Chloroflexota bacterium]
MTEASLLKRLGQIAEDYEREWQEKLQGYERRIEVLEQENKELRQELELRLAPLGEISDETLRSRLARLGSAPLDTVIREAGVVLEDRLRTVGKADSTLHGTQLVDAVLNPETGTLRFSSHRGEQDGVRMLYRGAMQFARNPPMHRLIEYPEDTARLFIRLIDALLQLLSDAENGGEPTRKTWSPEEFFRVLVAHVDPSVVSLVKEIYEWGQSKADRIWFGTGKETGSFTYHYLRDGKTFSVFTIYTNGKLGLNYGALSGKLDHESLEQFHAKLTSIPAFKRVRADFSKWPSISLAGALEKPKEREEFKDAVCWLKSRID